MTSILIRLTRRRPQTRQPGQPPLQCYDWEPVRATPKGFVRDGQHLFGTLEMGTHAVELNNRRVRLGAVVQAFGDIGSDTAVWFDAPEHLLACREEKEGEQ